MENKVHTLNKLKKSKRYKYNNQESFLTVLYEGRVNIYYDTIIDIFIFENEKFSTTDIFEGIVLTIMNIPNINDEVWSLNIKNILSYNINYQSGLFWLSGGFDEWRNGSYYNTEWHNVMDNYVNNFKAKIIEVLEHENLSVIRKHILSNLSLPILYDFALKKKYIN